MSRKFLAIGFLALLSMTVSAQITVTDATIEAGQSVTFTADNEYLLDGFVFVEEGATLNIQAGTVIKAKATATTGDNASALIIARGGQIFANGTAQNPVVFTAESDDINDPNDLSGGNRGLWGGVILLGRATTNRGVEGQIEGIPSDETRAAYGGNDDTDNSGVLRYVSIRHAGAELGPGDEINGLTFGAVGSGTIVEHIEVFANLDDGYEWFGGTVNTKYLVAAFCADDAFDYDEGWRGKNQFWFAIQSTDKAGRVGEHDGGTINETGTPFSTPTFYNATYIGPGISNFPEGDGGEAIIFRDNAGGSYLNSIISNYNGANDGAGVRVEDIEGEDSRSRLDNGDLRLANNIWWQFGNGNTLEAIAPQEFVRTYLANNNNTIADPAFGGISRSNNGNLNPRPSATGPAASGAMAPTDPFFMNVSYRGAFDPAASLWTDGWTALWKNGYTAQVAPEVNSKLLYSWVSNSQQFDSTVIVNNLGSSAADVLLTATREDGTTEMADPMTIPAGGFVSMKAADLFTTFGVGRGYTVTLESSSESIAGRWVTNDKTNLSPSQGVAVSIKEAGDNVGGAVSFGFLPGSNGFQSAPVIVNSGDQPVNVTVYYFNTSGSLVDSDTISGLGPQTPVIPRFIDTSAGDVHAVAVADGGMITGAVFVFNADGQTAIGSVTSVEGFQAPQ